MHSTPFSVKLVLGKDVPRAVFVDLEPTVIDEVTTGEYHLRGRRLPWLASSRNAGVVFSFFFSFLFFFSFFKLFFRMLQ
jgi:hypothetical protein